MFDSKKLDLNLGSLALSCKAWASLPQCQSSGLEPYDGGFLVRESQN